MQKQALFALALGALLVPALSAAPAEAATIIIHRSQPQPQPQVVVVHRQAPAPRQVVVRYEEPRHHHGRYVETRHVESRYDRRHEQDRWHR